MKIRIRFAVFAISILFPIFSVQAQNASLSGTVTERTTETPLIGANVRLQDVTSGTMITGSATNEEGRYQISVAAGSYDIVVTFVGYVPVTQQISLSAGQSLVLDIQMDPEGFGLEQVVVSASRQAEKVLDAPASVSVLAAEEVENQTAPNSAAVLRNVEGVDLAQTGVDRYELVLRGFNNAFSGAAYTLVDYRQAAVASLNVNAYSMMPISNIDLERVEIVRGPGSALYGPGVDAGVIHFITKNPFDHQGTTITLGGGELQTRIAGFRHAGVSSTGKLAYKLAGQITHAHEVEMDLDSPIDFQQLDTNGDELVVLENDNGSLVAYQVNASETGTDVVTSDFSQSELALMRDVPREYDAGKFNLNGMIEYKMGNRTSLIANGGYMSASGPFLSGIGNLYGKGFGYSYGQLRLQSGNLFASLSLNKSSAGDSYVLGNRRLDSNGDVLQVNGVPIDGVVSDNSLKWNFQTQYNHLLSEQTNLIYGLDYQYTIPRTGGTIYGRNESSDEIAEYGAYIQGQHKFSDRFDLTLAARGDYNNIIDAFQVSPRVAMVFKPSKANSVRATYNRAFSSPGNNSLFLDIPASTIEIPIVGTVTVRGRGSVQGYTFNRTGNNEYGNIVASSLLPWNVGADMDPALDLGGLYNNLVYPGLNALPNAAIASQLELALGLPTGSFNPDIVGGLKQLLDPSLTQVSGSVTGILVNPLTGALITGVNDVKALAQTTTQTVELGYKGLLGEKFLLAVDGYYTKRENFVGPLLVETPMVIADAFRPEMLAGALAGGINGNAILMAQLAQLNAGFGLNLTPESIAGLIVGLANADGALSNLNQLPIAIVQPDENNPGVGMLPELMLTYRNFGSVDLAGVDLSMRYLIDSGFSVFANGSWIMDNFFDESEIGEAGTGLYVALNAPRLKFKVGGDYNKPGGFSANLSLRYTEGFPIASGPYVGGLPGIYNNPDTILDDFGVKDYTLLDVGFGYDFSKTVPGLRADVLVQDVTDNKVRQFLGAPAIGRYTTARLTFSF